jgi:hypothetical protein
MLRRAKNLLDHANPGGMATAVPAADWNPQHQLPPYQWWEQEQTLTEP